MTEADLEQAVIESAQLRGWLVAHFRPAQTKRGWRTAVAGDGAGFPDLVLVRRERLLVRELKTDHGRLDTLQRVWLDVLNAAGVDADVWRPADWLDGSIDLELGPQGRRA